MLLGLCWSSTYFAVKVAVFSISPELVTLGRMAIAAVVFVLLMKAKGHAWPTDGGVWGLFLVLALLGNTLPNYLIAWAEVRVDSGLAGILLGAMPLMTIMLAHWLTADEKLSAGRLAGVGLGLAGIIVSIGPAALSGLGADFWAQLALLGAAACYAGNAIAARRLGVLPITVTGAGVTVLSTALMFPGAVAMDDGGLAGASATSIVAVVWLALIGTTTALLLYYVIVRAAGATFVGLANYLVPPFALILGAAFLAERPRPEALLALVLILAGIFVTGRQRH